MSQAYLEVVERFIKLQNLINEDDKDMRRKPKKVARIASMLAMASLHSNFSLDKQYAVYKAMIQTMSEEIPNFRALGDSVDDIAANLILASELNKRLRLKR
ncbi:MAG: hypothetical protein ACFFE8_05410 [Candidatus Heimdallarchaeota archaeon]